MLKLFQNQKETWAPESHSSIKKEPQTQRHCTKTSKNQSMIKRKILQVSREEKRDYPQMSIIRMTELSPLQPELLKENKEKSPKCQNSTCKLKFKREGKRKIFPYLQANWIIAERSNMLYTSTWEAGKVMDCKEQWWTNKSASHATISKRLIAQTETRKF